METANQKDFVHWTMESGRMLYPWTLYMDYVDWADALDWRLDCGNRTNAIHFEIGLRRPEGCCILDYEH